MIRVSFDLASTLDEPMVRAMWQLRLRFMSLRPGIDPELDYQKFSAIVRKANTAMLAQDEAGALVGMFTCRAEPRTFEGRSFVWVFPEFGFLDPLHRGGMRFHWGANAMIQRLRRPYWHLPAYVVSSGWPSGFLSYRMIADLRILGDPTASGWEERMLTSLAEELGGDDWDSEHRRMRMRVVPAFPFRTPTTPAAQEAYAYYLRHNPAWREGYTAVVYHRMLPEPLDWLRLAGGVVSERIRSRIRKARRA